MNFRSRFEIPVLPSLERVSPRRKEQGVGRTQGNDVLEKGFFAGIRLPISQKPVNGRQVRFRGNHSRRENGLGFGGKEKEGWSTIVIEGFLAEAIARRNKQCFL